MAICHRCQPEQRADGWGPVNEPPMDGECFTEIRTQNDPKIHKEQKKPPQLLFFFFIFPTNKNNPPST